MNILPVNAIKLKRYAYGSMQYSIKQKTISFKGINDAND